jgi:hypothetical protein
MIYDRLKETIQKLETATPIRDFKFGHTPLQIECFQTASQQGNEKWEYWQHLLQLKALYSTLCDLKVTYDEISYEIEDSKSFWPPWSYKKRKRGLARLQFKLDTIQRSTEEKTREVDYHLAVIEHRYSHLKDLREVDILKEEAPYWSLRLGRQLGASHLSRVLGVSEGELLAVLSLPEEQQHQVFDGMKQMLMAVNHMLPSQKREEIGD